jgi:hypothetical protein
MTTQPIVIQNGGSALGNAAVNNGANIAMALIVLGVCRYQELDWTTSALVAASFFVIITVI